MIYKNTLLLTYGLLSADTFYWNIQQSLNSFKGERFRLSLAMTNMFHVNCQRCSVNLQLYTPPIYTPPI